MESSSSVYLGVNLNFAKFVYGHKKALEVARNEIGAYYVEIVPDIDYGPVFYVTEPDRFREHYLEVGRYAKELGIGIPTLLTFYRDNNSILHSDPVIREHAFTVMRAMAVQAGCLGCKVAGGSFGTVLAEDMEERFDECVAAGLEYWKLWLDVLYEEGVGTATIETMSTLREPPATISFAKKLMDSLGRYHADNAATTARPAFCYDLGHGVADEECDVPADRDFVEWFKAFPRDIIHLHVKNTDSKFMATWPFTADYAEQGIIDLHRLARAVRNHLDGRDLFIMVEMPGKRGRLIGERDAIEANRQSFTNLKQAFRDEGFVENHSDHIWSVAE